MNPAPEIKEIRTLLSKIDRQSHEIVSAALYELGESFHKAHLLAMQTQDSDLSDELVLFENETKSVIENTFKPKDRKSASYRQAAHFVKAVGFLNELSGVPAA